MASSGEDYEALDCAFSYTCTCREEIILVVATTQKIELLSCIHTCYQYWILMYVLYTRTFLRASNRTASSGFVSLLAISSWIIYIIHVHFIHKQGTCMDKSYMLTFACPVCPSAMAAACLTSGLQSSQLRTTNLKHKSCNTSNVEMNNIHIHDNFLNLHVVEPDQMSVQTHIMYMYIVYLCLCTSRTKYDATKMRNGTEHMYMHMSLHKTEQGLGTNSELQHELGET